MARQKRKLSKESSPGKGRIRPAYPGASHKKKRARYCPPNLAPRGNRKNEGGRRGPGIPASATGPAWGKKKKRGPEAGHALKKKIKTKKGKWRRDCTQDKEKRVDSQGGRRQGLAPGRKPGL